MADRIAIIIVWRKKIVDLKRPRFIFLFFLFIIPFSVFAGDFDGSKPLSGSVDKILEIYPSRISNDADPDTVGLPQNFFIDFEEKIVRPSKDSLIRRTSKIKRVEHIENKLILQGVEDGVENVDDGLAWSIAISKKTGKVVLSASGDGVAYVVFGTCTAVENF
jgi:hypothetical protein